LAVPDVPIPFSRALEQFAIPQVGNIVSASRALVNTNSLMKVSQ